MGSPSQRVSDDRIVRRRRADQSRVLSIGQERLWYLNQIIPDHPVYNLAFWCPLKGNLNLNALRAALTAVVKRHEVLRTVILAPGGRPTPVSLKKGEVELKEIDLRRPPAGVAGPEEILRNESARPFNFSRETLLRAAVIRISDDEYIFLHNAPHLVFEGGSVEILYKELEFYYRAHVAGRTGDEMPGLPIQYCDFACWQRDFLRGERLEQLMQNWQRALANPPLLDLPLDLPRPPVHTMRGRHRFFAMRAGVLERITHFLSAKGITRYRGLCSAFFIFLHAYSGQSDILLGSPFAPRCAGIENLIGFFVNTVVLRADLSGQPSFLEVVRRVDRIVREAIENSDLTTDKMVEAARISRDTSRTPLFQANFRAPKRPYPCLNLEGMEGERARYADNGTSKFDLSLEIDAVGKDCFFEYCSDLFRPGTIEQMITDFEALVEELISRPEIPVSELKMVREIGARRAF